MVKEQWKERRKRQMSKKIRSMKNLVFMALTKLNDKTARQKGRDEVEWKENWKVPNKQ